MATTLIRNAQAIVTVDREDRVLRGENILVQDNVIRYIGPEERPADRVIDASHCFVYPGLVNTHHHLYQTFTRNLPKVQKMELFPWLRTLYEIWRGLDEDCTYYSSLVGLGELLKYGCTTCMDHHYVFPRVGSEHFIDQQFRAADLLGVRFHATRGSMSRGKSDGGLPPDDLVQDVDTILRDSRRLVEKFHDTSRFSMHQVALAPCSPFSVTTDLLKQSAVLARSMGVRLHTHLCETKDEERFTLEAVGMRPLAYMESCGWLGEDVWYAHGIHFNDQELRLLARTGTGIAHCPVSNMKLASGVAPVPAMLDAGVRLALGSDGAASNNRLNMFTEMGRAALLHKAAGDPETMPARTVLDMATRGGAAAMGGDGGVLAVGRPADCIALDLSAPNMQPLFNAASHAVYAATGMEVALTMVAGEVLYRDGRFSRFDYAALCAEVRDMRRFVLRRLGLPEQVA